MPELSSAQAERLQHAVAEIATRKTESLRLYEPQPVQEAFHKSKASERVLRGGNRSGKSTAGFVEFARAALSRDPYKKYPTNRPLLMYTIGFDADHIGRVIHRMLFRAGAFRIIRDLDTGEWRAFRPWDEMDAARIDEAKPAPPLIPPRYIAAFAWDKKHERVFSCCTLHNGTEIRAFSSKAEPAQGDPVDVVHIDEDLDNEAWVGEMQARLSDLKGRMFWTAFPHSKNDALVSLSERAEKERNNPKPDVEEFVLTFSRNRYIDEEEKHKRLKAWSPEERRARDAGEYTFDSVLMYPNFSMAIHGAPRDDRENDAVDEAASGTIPDDWCRYMVVDPGHTVCAVLFAAVPPPNVGDFVFLYDELYLTRCDAEKFGNHVAEKVAGNVFQAFIIDDHYSRMTQPGSGKTVKHSYTEALSARGVRSVQTGSGFLGGSDDVRGRCEQVRIWMNIRGDGTTKLRVKRGQLPNFEAEAKTYRKKMRDNVVLDEPIQKHNHLMDCVGYLAAYDPKYVAPKRASVRKSPALQLFESWREKRARRESRPFVHLGVGAG